MNNGLVVCPCCGQLISVTYSDLYGFFANYPVSNMADFQRQQLEQQVSSLYSQWEAVTNEQLLKLHLKDMLNSQ